MLHFWNPVVLAIYFCLSCACVLNAILVQGPTRLTPLFNSEAYSECLARPHTALPETVAENNAEAFRKSICDFEEQTRFVAAQGLEEERYGAALETSLIRWAVFPVAGLTVVFWMFIFLLNGEKGRRTAKAEKHGVK